MSYSRIIHHLFFFILVLIIGFSSIGYTADSYFNKSEKAVVCKEPLPIFTLGENSNPNNKQVSKLCSCVWNEFPKGGWEQKTSEKIRNGNDPGWRGKGLIQRFSKALDKCGGYKL